MPGPAIASLMIGSAALFFGLAAWGWGGWGGLFAHPARAGAFAVMIAATVAALCTDLHLGGCTRPDAHGRWIIAPVVLISLILAWLPAYSERRGLWTLDGDAARYLGLALFAAGAVLRVGPMFVLGRRFTWPLAGQESHRLVTTGFYRVVRHPSYLGGLLGIVGWVLVFRSGIGLLLCLLLVPVFLVIIRKEEARLLSEFGDDYAAYRQRTWRLVPFLY